VTDSPLITPTATSHRPVTRHQATQLDAFLEEERERCWIQRRFPLSETEHRKVMQNSKAKKFSNSSQEVATLSSTSAKPSPSAPSSTTTPSLDSQSKTVDVTKQHVLRSRSNSANSSSNSSHSPLHQSFPTVSSSSSSLPSNQHHQHNSISSKPLAQQLLENNLDKNSPIFFKSPSMTPIQSPTSVRSGATSPMSLSPQPSSNSSVADGVSSQDTDTWTVKLIAGTEESPTMISLEASTPIDSNCVSSIDGHDSANTVTDVNNHKHCSLEDLKSAVLEHSTALSEDSESASTVVAMSKQQCGIVLKLAKK
jgi:hypothetical protein